MIMTLPKKVSALAYFSARLNGWLSDGSERLLWLSSWETEPPQPLLFFEEIRKGSGDSRHIIDAPGHLLETPNSTEAALLTGLIFLVIGFGWEAYIVPQELADFVYLGDEHVVCSSARPEKMRELSEMVAAFGLRTINDIREAWD